MTGSGRRGGRNTMRNETMQSHENAPETYPVADFYLAAFLITSGFELLRVELAGENRVLFLLRDTPQRTQVVADFYGRRAVVDPLAFKDAIVNLKSLIHGILPRHLGQKNRL